MSVLSIQTRRIDGLTEATTAEDEDLLLIRKADGTGTRNIKKKNLIPKVVDKVGGLDELTTYNKTSIVKAVNETISDIRDLIRHGNTIEEKLKEIRGENNTDRFHGLSGNHNAIYRGKGLSFGISEDQIKEIRNGTFSDMYIGDYFYGINTEYRIAHFDYFPIADHHVVLLPNYSERDVVYSTNGSDSDPNGGYYNSFLRNYIENTFKQNLENFIKKYLKAVPVSVSDKTYPAQGSVASRITSTMIETPLCAMTLEMMLGFPAPWAGEDERLFNNGQFAIFQYNRRKMYLGNYWLGDLYKNKVGWTYEFGFRKEPTYAKYAARPFIVIG